jgi:hypothetical protein
MLLLGWNQGTHSLSKETVKTYRSVRHDRRYVATEGLDESCDQPMSKALSCCLPRSREDVTVSNVPVIFFEACEHYALLGYSTTEVKSFRTTWLRHLQLIPLGAETSFVDVEEAFANLVAIHFALACASVRLERD